MQVRLADGSRIVVKLNHDHTVEDVKQEIMSRQLEVRDMVWGAAYCNCYLLCRRRGCSS